MFERFRFDAKRARDAGNGASAAGLSSAEDDAEAEGAAVNNKRSRVKEEPQPEPVATIIDAAEPVAVPPTPKWQERWHAICASCFEGRVKCEHFEERRLRLLIVGHNPSDHAWQSGYSYSNPSNRFWNLLRGSLPPLSWRGILPAGVHIGEQNNLPHVYGVGMTSIGLEPGNDAASYGKDTMNRWRIDFFRRLRNHVKLVCINSHGCSVDEAPCSSLPHTPMIVAFSGKRQFSFLFTPPLTKVENYGLQTRLPTGWPRECLADCEVWVLPSSSGRAAMTTAQRAQPYQQMADRFHEMPWPEAPLPVLQIKDEPAI